MRKQILSYAFAYQGDWKKIAQAIALQTPWEKADCKENYVCITDADYPERLKELECPPWILFYRGDITLLNKRGVGIVGSRQCSVYGRKMCQYIVELLCDQAVIISGLAMGIDACAHERAMMHKTIGLIGCGIDVIYPKQNQKLYEEMERNQLILSEYPPGVKPFAHHFPWRNRLIAALSDAVVVVEAKCRSGTMLTVNEALKLNREVYCIPHDYNKEEGRGCNLLISQGANILVDEEDILNIFHK